METGTNKSKSYVDLDTDNHRNATCTYLVHNSPPFHFLKMSKFLTYKLSIRAIFRKDTIIIRVTGSQSKFGNIPLMVDMLPNDELQFNRG